MPQHIDANAAEEVGADGAQFLADGFADALFEIEIEGRTPRHGDGEAGRRADHHAPWPVAEGEARDPQPFDAGGGEGALVVPAVGEIAEPGPERKIAVETPELFLDGHLGDDGRRGQGDRDPVVDRGDCIAIGGGVVFHRTTVVPACVGQPGPHVKEGRRDPTLVGSRRPSLCVTAAVPTSARRSPCGSGPIHRSNQW